MEPLTLFAATVGLIGGIHLVSTTFERFGKGRYDKGNQQAKREDWNKTDKRTKQPTLTDAERLEQMRRQQANRPRLQA